MPPFSDEKSFQYAKRMFPLFRAIENLIWHLSMKNSFHCSLQTFYRVLCRPPCYGKGKKILEGLEGKTSENMNDPSRSFSFMRERPAIEACH